MTDDTTPDVSVTYKEDTEFCFEGIRASLPLSFEWDCPKCGEGLYFDDYIYSPKMNGLNTVQDTCCECGQTSGVEYYLEFEVDRCRVVEVAQ